MSKVSVCAKIMIENQKQREKIWKLQKFFLHKYLSNRWFRNGIHSLLSRADASGSALCVKYVTHIATL